MRQKQVTIDKFIAGLTPEDRKYLLQRLSIKVFGSINKTVEKCPCCDRPDFKKCGEYKGTPKYKCKHTHKVFTYKTRLVVSGIYRIDKLEQLLDMMASNNFPRIREIADTLGVCRQTAQDWRNKIMSALYLETNMAGHIIEFDETNFMHSDKGRKDLKDPRKRGGKFVGDNDSNVKVFMAWSRATNKLELYQSHMGRTSAQDVENYLSPKKDIVIYSDMHNAYKKYCDDHGIEQKAFLSSDHISLKDNTVHNQNINLHCRDLQNFLNEDLKGVSTKYLQGYLNWYMFIHNVIKKKEGRIKEQIVDNKVALDIYKQKEREYLAFLQNNGKEDKGQFKDKYFPKKIKPENSDIEIPKEDLDRLV